MADLFTPAVYKSTNQHSTTPINLHPSFPVFLMPFPSSLNNGCSVLCKHSYLIRYGPYPRMAISDPSTGPPPFSSLLQRGGGRPKNKHLNVTIVSTLIYGVNVPFYSPARGPSYLKDTVDIACFNGLCEQR